LQNNDKNFRTQTELAQNRRNAIEYGEFVHPTGLSTGTGRIHNRSHHDWYVLVPGMIPYLHQYQWYWYQVGHARSITSCNTAGTCRALVPVPGTVLVGPTGTGTGTSGQVLR